MSAEINTCNVVWNYMFLIHFLNYIYYLLGIICNNIIWKLLGPRFQQNKVYIIHNVIIVLKGISNAPSLVLTGYGIYNSSSSHSGWEHTH